MQRPPPSRPQEESFTQSGWTVTSRKAPIIGSPLLEEYSEQLGGVLTLPEILFGNSSLQLRHDASGVTLRFTAFEALQQWKADDLPPLKVPVAREWQASRQQEIEAQNAVVLDYDWTYTTSYAGSLCYTQPVAGSSKSGSSSSSDAAGSADQAARTGGAGAVESDKADPGGGVGDATAAAAAAADGPSTSASAGPIPDQGSCQQQQQQQEQVPQQQLPAWQPSSRQIDRHMLMSKAEPILFYAEVPLYESELDDNGVCQLTVKVRVMPRCWLVLLRLWLRVDGCLVRLREVRHFCRLDTPTPVVIRETKWSEGTTQELAAAGAPSTVAGYEDADAATAVFAAIAPQCLTRFELHELHLGPVGSAAAGAAAAAEGGKESGGGADAVGP